MFTHQPARHLLRLLAGGLGLLAVAHQSFGQQFQVPVTLAPTHSEIYSVAVGDLNQDGRPDIAYTAFEKVAWLRNLGGGAFAAPVVLETAFSTSYVQLADMNRDNRLDLVVNFVITNAAVDDGVYLFLNQGSGTFAARRNWHTFIQSSSALVLADFDADGDPDLISVNEAGGGRTHLMLNNGTGVPTSGTPRYLVQQNLPFPNDQARYHEWGAAGHFDGDGRVDVALASSSEDFNVRLGKAIYGALDVLPNLPATGFAINTFHTPHQTSNTADFQLTAFAAANLDGTGGDDLIYSERYYGLRWIPNKGSFFSATTQQDIEFLDRPNAPLYETCPGVAVADFDGNGHRDLVAVFRTEEPSGLPDELVLFRNQGAGVLAPPSDYLIDTSTTNAVYASALATGDFNGDGAADLVLGRRNSTGLGLYLNEFSAPAVVYARSYGLTGANAYRFADPDQDGNDNATEFQDSTNPNLATSVRPRLIITITGPGSVSAAPTKAIYNYGEAVTLTATPTAPASLLAWSGDASGAVTPLSLTMNRTRRITAGFGISLSDSLDQPALTFTTSPEARWFNQTTTTQVGGDAAQSAPIGNFGTSWLETTVQGPGAFSFWWKVSSEPNDDLLECLITSPVQTYIHQASISGATAWSRQTIPLPLTGTYTVNWRYRKGFANQEGSDAGWVDGVEWTPQVTFSAWAAAASLTGSNAQPLAIPRGDGVANLLKYAFNMNAAAADRRILIPGTGTAGLPGISLAGTPAARLLRVEFLRRKDSGLTYTPRKTTSVAAGPWQVLTDTPTVTNIDATWERVLYEEPVTGARWFARVEVVLP